MRISKDLPQFNNKKTILILVSEKEAQFYAAGDGIIEKLSEIRISPTQYRESSRQFRAMVKGAKGGIFRTPSRYETAKTKELHKFLRLFSQILK